MVSNLEVASLLMSLPWQSISRSFMQQQIKGFRRGISKIPDISTPAAHRGARKTLTANTQMRTFNGTAAVEHELKRSLLHRIVEKS